LSVNKIAILQKSTFKGKIFYFDWIYKTWLEGYAIISGSFIYIFRDIHDDSFIFYFCLIKAELNEIIEDVGKLERRGLESKYNQALII